MIVTLISHFWTAVRCASRRTDVNVRHQRTTTQRPPAAFRTCVSTWNGSTSDQSTTGTSSAGLTVEELATLTNLLKPQREKLFSAVEGKSSIGGRQAPVQTTKSSRRQPPLGRPLPLLWRQPLQLTSQPLVPRLRPSPAAIDGRRRGSPAESVKPQSRYGYFRFFKMAAAAILDFWNFKFLTWGRSRGSNYTLSGMALNQKCMEMYTH